jgi:hypothetical protein
MRSEYDALRIKVNELDAYIAKGIKEKEEEEKKSERKNITGCNSIKDKHNLQVLQNWVQEEGKVKEFKKIFTATVNGWNA